MKQTLTQNKNRATNTVTTLIADQEHLYNLEFCSPGVKRVASHFGFFPEYTNLGFVVIAIEVNTGFRGQPSSLEDGGSWK